MELSQEFLLEMAINAGGYLLAGIISIIFYAMMQKKRVSQSFDEVVSEHQKTIQTIEKSFASEPQKHRRVEFISFNQERTQPRNIAENTLHDHAQDTNGRMSRKEAITLAKKMLLAGATHEKIKKILPVSESELTLLSLNNK